MQDGYSYLFRSNKRSRWAASSSERWAIVVYSPKGTERLIGSRVIDDVRCNVWACPDGKLRAQMAR